MSLHIPFDNSFAALPEGLYTRLGPTPVRAPQLLAFNADLARLMGIDRGSASDADLALVFSGNAEATGAAPLAQVYAGHQFGNWNPQLGDGRALLLGETVGTDGQRRDIQLKGSGPTPYSRMGDGRAWLGPVLREYVVSEAMHALGIPTTRALAAVQTGEPVYREDGALPGAVLTRVAASHLRVGTFQYFAARGDIASLRTLTEHAIARHDPQAGTPLALLEGVIARQARLIAQWMGVGFIHGVMNTDNTAISGETIDYGPCAFIDDFHPATVFSSIDRQGRYAYQNQPDIIVWNMAQLATALLPLEEDRDSAIAAYTRAVHAMPGLIRAAWTDVFAAKIGISQVQEGDAALVTDLLTLMAGQGADFTNSFRALATGSARDQFTDRAAFDTWAARWQARIADAPEPEALMRRSNPALHPRNHLIERMIAAARSGDMAPFHRLMAALATPYTAPEGPDAAELTRPPLKHEVVQATFCGT